MDFDAYDYLEKTVENPEPGKEKEGAVNGGGEIEKSGNKERSRSSKHKKRENTISGAINFYLCGLCGII
ncbi:hypothetical protein CFP56_017037 [Quercus suber]|uniref:Uncharacterized protein n=1 Tax=Quercus suber TaxID=58331 RepID=A0AAW0M441_QUESU